MVFYDKAINLGIYEDDIESCLSVWFQMLQTSVTTGGLSVY